MVRFAFVRRMILAERTHVARAIWAIVAVALPTGLRLVIDGGANGVPFVTYFPAMLIAALALGWQYASISTIASAIVANRLFIHRPNLLDAGGADLAIAGLFLVSCALLIATGESLRRTLRDVELRSDREATLTNEMRHRVRNVLSVVQATAALTMRYTGPNGFLDAFAGRINALAKANDMLTLDRNGSHEIENLIQQVIQPFLIGDNIAMQGPPVWLPADCCVPAALAIHELCTNALKYGALSVSDGKVAIRWAQIDNAVEILWKETGGPPVSEPTRQGAGTRLLKSQPALGDVEIRFEEDGLACNMSIKGVGAA